MVFIFGLILRLEVKTLDVMVKSLTTKSLKIWSTESDAEAKTAIQEYSMEIRFPLTKWQELKLTTIPIQSS